MAKGQEPITSDEEIKDEYKRLRLELKEKQAELEKKNQQLYVETALEKVRSRTMAMQSSEELPEVANIMFLEVQALGIPAWSCGYCILLEDRKSSTCIMSSEGTLQKPFLLPHYGEVSFDEWNEFIHGDHVFFTQELSGDTIESHYNFMKSLPQLGPIFKEIQDAGLSLPEYQINHLCKFDHGFLLFITYEKVPESHEIFKRFTSVFNQTYTRFLDIQKAEAQSRESQIQLALERVRARTMAMQSSEELADAAFVLFEQLRNLGGNLWGTGFGLCKENTDKDEFWFANENGVFPPVAIPNTTDPAHKQMYQGWQEKSDFLSIEKSGVELEKHYDYMLSLPEVRPFFQKIIGEGLSFPEKQQWNAAYFSKGYLLIITLEPYPEPEIFKRFAKVFEQTYTRFLDLQKAEAQAREAKIETSLERVRSRTMAMHKSDELQEVIQVVYAQFADLGIQVDHTGFIIDYLTNEDMHIWLADRNGVPTEITIPYFDAPHWNSFVRAKKNGDDFFVNHHSFDEKNSFYKALFERIPRLSEEIKTYYLECPGLDISTVLMEDVGLYIERFSGTPYSDAENQTLKRFGKVFQQTYTRFIDLQNAEAQAREAKIETALEKVRSRTMAMQHSDELQEASYLLDQQVRALGIQTWGCAFNIYGEEDSTEWFGNEAGVLHTYTVPRKGIFKEYYEKGQKGESLVIKEFSGKACVDHYEYMSRLPVLGDVLKILKETNDGFPSYQIDHVVYFKYGYLLFITREDVPEAHDIFKRFAKVFEQTYTRFLDLQKAEAQAREAQIEAAVERVRAQSMAMHHTDDLHKVTKELLHQLNGLSLDGLTGTTIYLVDENDIVRAWDLSSPGSVGTPDSYTVTYDAKKYPILGGWVNEWRASDQNYFALEFPKEILWKAVEEWKEVHPEIAKVFKDAVDSGKLTHQWSPSGRLSKGILAVDLTKPPTEDTENIVTKMAGAFNLAYQRFEDLQKAEAQAREAKIETALEKVRSRTMGMQKSDELADVADVLFKEMNELVHNLWTCGFVLCEKNRTEDEWWLGLEEGFTRGFFLPNVNDFAHAHLYEGWLKGESFRTVQLEGDDLQAHYEWLMEIPVAKKIFDDMEAAGMQRPEWQKLHAAYFSRGYLVIITREPCAEEAIFKRFAQVFDLTYTRFLDLQKAEAQARESQIELSLERIRAQVTGMQESSDLLDIVVTMRTEFVNLGHEAHYFWHMRWLPDTYKKAMTSGDGTKIGMVMTLPRHIHGDIQAVAAWEKTKDPIHVLAMDVDAAVDYVDKMITLGDFERVDPQAPSLDDIRHIGGLTFVMARTTHGEIGYSLPGVVPNPPKDAVDTLVRFAKVFDLAYKRFEDLKTAEKDLIEIKRARQKAEDALIELKATQTQLVQQEKLASLGQLTAGIAHEIKNPLNFVNNFSEVSLELIEEALGEIKEIQENEHASEASEILGDVQFNLKKIHEHGTRANGIVSSMLQHSRGGSGKMEPTDLNALITEYVNLSFHGMRAGKNPINVKLNFDLDENLGQVNLIGEDFSRVVLNLANNAFDAMREKAKKAKDYLPKFSVKTRLTANGEQLIAFSDNGPGIPEHIKDKILQPFFTTKKGTEGTGLGLSITNDIVKAHGGTLDIDSKPGETNLRIILKF